MLLTTPPSSLPAAQGLVETTMADGTVLVLEEVTVGTSHSFLKAPKDYPRGLFARFMGIQSPSFSVSEGTSQDSLVLWFTRHDSTSGRALDFDWWTHCIAVDDQGWEVVDEQAGRHAFGVAGSEGISGSRPFEPVSSYPNRLIVAHSMLPMMRPVGGTFTLRIYDRQNALVAEMQVPNPVQGPFPVWTPHPLPASRTNRGLTLTLKSLEARCQEQAYEVHPRRKAVHVLPGFEFQEGGMPSAEGWETDVQLSDPLGNTGRCWDCTLSPYEPAWKLHVSAWRNSLGWFDPSEEWKVGQVTIPQSGSAVLLGQSQTIQGVTVELVAVGLGKVAYTDPSAIGSQSTSSSSGSVGTIAYEVQVRDVSGTKTSTVTQQSGTGQLGHVLVRVSGLDDQHRIFLELKDDQGRTIQVTPIQIGDMLFELFELPQDTESIEIRMLVQQRRFFEFFVAPPAIEE
ncbi:MAG: hypothetical protein ACKV0T_25435 [Planctomycetales bacterium]